MVSQGVIRTGVEVFADTSRLVTGLGVADRAMLATERRAERLDATTENLGGRTRLAETRRQVRGLGDDAESTERSLRSLGAGLTALAGGAAIGGILVGATDRLREIRDIQRELGGADAQAAQRVIVGAEAAGFDPGNIAGAIFDATERAQEQLAGTVNLDLSGFGLDADTFAQGLLNAGNEADRLRFLLDTLNGLPTDQRLAFLAETAGGSAQAIALMANDADLAARFLNGMAGAAVQDADSLNRLADAQAGMAELTNALSILAGEFAAGLTPAIQLAADAAGIVSGAFTALNEAIPGSGTVLAVGLAIGTVAIAALAAIGPLYGMAAAGFAAIAPLLPFIAIGVGVVAAVAAIAAGVAFLADRLGGFGNLWASVWDSAVIIVLGAVRAMLTPMGLLIDALNGISGFVGRFTGIDIPQIANPVNALDEEIASRANNIGGRWQEAARDRRVEERQANRREGAGGVNITVNSDITGVQDADEAAERTAALVSQGLALRGIR